MASPLCPKCNPEKDTHGGWLSSRTFYVEGKRHVELYCWRCGHSEPVS